MKTLVRVFTDDHSGLAVWVSLARGPGRPALPHAFPPWSDADLSISDELKRDFEAWIRWNDRLLGDLADSDSWREHDAAGALLADRLQEELGEEFEVTFHP